MKHFVLAVIFLSATTASVACSFKPQTDEQLIADAKNVFRARVTEVKEVLKGTPPASGIVRDFPFGPGNCSLGLFPGLEYVFFPEKFDMVTAPTGSFAYFNAKGTEVKPRLESLRKLATAVK